MTYALTWGAVLLLLGLWSLAAWALHAAAAWSAERAGHLAGRTADATIGSVPDAMAPWVPVDLVQAFNAMVATLAPLVDALLASAPSLAGGLSIAIWVLWGAGAALLVGLGVAVHGLSAWLRRSVERPDGRRHALAVDRP